VGLILILAFVVSSIYKSNLTAMMTTPILDKGFETIEEAIRQKEVSLLMINDTLISDIIKVREVYFLSRLFPCWSHELFLYFGQAIFFIMVIWRIINGSAK